MVLQKRLDYGFNGYQVPAMPRASRSARGRGSAKKKIEEKQMCAFELLATVAGKLLQEKEASLTPCDVSAARTRENVKEFKEKEKNGGWSLLGLGRSLASVRETIKQEMQDEEKPCKVEPCDQASSDESALASRVGSQPRLSCQAQNYTSKEYTNAQNDGASRPVSRIAKSYSSEHVACAEELIIHKGSSKFANSSVDSVVSARELLKVIPENIHGKCETGKGSADYAESCEAKIADEIDRQLETEQKRIGNAVSGTPPDMCSSEEPMELDTKPHGLVSSDSSADAPLCCEHITCSSFPRCRDDMKNVVSRDDDENSSGCTQPSTISVKAFRPSCVGDRKIRKLLAPEFWKVGSTLLNDGEISNTDMEMKPVFRSRKAWYTRQRTQRCSPSKRRKLLERNSISTSDGGIVCEVICNSTEKGFNGEAPGLGASFHRASEPSSPVTSSKSSYKSGDSLVKLNIKSFRVPELFFEMPETATVATLKRSVLETVTSMLGGGLRLSVLLQGKKVRDDSKTLLQAGISEGDKLDSVSFMLEPKPAHAQLPCLNDSHILLSCAALQPISRYPTMSTLDPMVADAAPGITLTNSGGWEESDHDSVLSPTADVPLDKTLPNSRSLLAVSNMSMEALAVVPWHRKSRRAELVQRRIRRPFSVTEVEALVQAVEKLGTGRWRDVKLRAFDNAKHRTYVDLKDKWKTLVHTARISPQQRRGEPVPQELLNRVLSAHAYWSQQQAKQQAETCLLL